MTKDELKKMLQEYIITESDLVPHSREPKIGKVLTANRADTIAECILTSFDRKEPKP